MGGARVEIGTPTHAVLDHYPAEGALAVCVSSSGMWMVTAYDGLLGWGPAPYI